MKIAVASGKGGTGKTTVSLALALTAPGKVSLLDCDVEEPNGDIFLDLENIKEEDVFVPVPQVDEKKCSLCGKCAEICQFNAIVFFGSPPMIFKELCHSCGGCAKVCPSSAIIEKDHKIGVVISGDDDSIEFFQGKMDIGVAMAPPVIKKVLSKIDNSVCNVIDAPPGTSCSMIEAVKDSDYTIIVTEPTPFGFNDMKIAVETVEKLSLDFGVIINKADTDYNETEKYCRNKKIEILMNIPNDISIAKAYSKGIPLTEAMPEYEAKFAQLWNDVSDKIGKK
jgi:MinD superfamily P-loop ATPase